MDEKEVEEKDENILDENDDYSKEESGDILDGESGDDDYLKEGRDNERKDINNEDNEESKKQNRVLACVLVFVVVGIASAVFVNNYKVSQKEFEYNNFTFEVLQEGNVKFYHTSFIIHKFFESANSNVPIKQTVDYNVYLRKDPRKLEKISFSGEMNRLEMMVLNDSGEFNCEGKGVIAIANMNQILNAIGTKVIRDDNATCDEQGRYMFVNIRGGDKTSVEQYGPSCYNINVDECEILEGTERFVLEMLNDVGSI